MGTITDIEAIAAATLLMGRVEQLATLTEVPGMLVRRSFTPQATEANRLVGAWMREAGMEVRTDAVCNLIGRYEGTTPVAKTLILGSHLDSVRDAGRYDGPLGVLAALACAEHLHRAGRRLPFALEVIAFTDEEGLRFRTSYVGSSATSGAFDPAWLEIADADGITMATAIRSAGGDPTAIRSCRYDPDRVLGYCEAHIEQGPALEDLDLPVGVVSAISSQERATVTFIGVAGHAGTVPMRLRHDALCAAAAFVLAVEATAAGTPGAVATVGQLSVSPGASNVIPGSATLSLDVRHRDDAQREALARTLRDAAEGIAAEREVRMDWQPVQQTAATPCAPALVEILAGAIESLGIPAHRLPSGAGHDGVPLSRLTQVAMLFVRCAGGISHNPAESVAVEDVAVALEVLWRALDRLATDPALAQS